MIIMNWKTLQSAAQLKKLIERSETIPCLIFKHSIRCNISAMIKHRLEGSWDFKDQEMEAYYLDLINHRSVSDEIAKLFEVVHESPQVLLIQNGACTYHVSHLDITVDTIREELMAA